MSVRFKFMILLGFILVISSNLPVVSGYEFDLVGVVSWVDDGDSFDMDNNAYSVRLADVNAPEWNEAGGQEAKSYMIDLIYGETLYLDVDDITQTDPYGRYVCVAYLKISDTEYMNINEDLIRKGYAEIVDYTNNEFDPFSWEYIVEDNQEPTYSISGTMFYNSQPLPDVTVELRLNSGQLLDTYDTGGDGKYLFDELVPDLYELSFSLIDPDFRDTVGQGILIEDADKTWDFHVSKEYQITSPYLQEEISDVNPIITWEEAEYVTKYSLELYRQTSSVSDYLGQWYVYDTSFQIPIKLDRNGAYAVIIRGSNIEKDSTAFYHSDFVLSKDYAVFRLTDNDYHDEHPRIDDGYITWHGWDGVSSWVHIFDGVSIYQSSAEEGKYYNPTISNDRIAFLGHEGEHEQVYLYENGANTQVSNDEWNKISLELDDAKVIWSAKERLENGEYGPKQIFLYESGSYRLISDTNYRNHGIKIHNGQTVWLGEYSVGDSIGPSQVFLHNGESTVQLTDSIYKQEYLSIFNSEIAWQGYDGNDYEIFHYDGHTISQLTDNDYADKWPCIYDGIVAWVSPDQYDTYLNVYENMETTRIHAPYCIDVRITDGFVVYSSGSSQGYDVYIYDGSEVTQLTNDDINNDFDDWYTAVDDGQFVWLKSHKTSGGTYHEIHMYDGSSVIPITNNQQVNWHPDISNGEIAYYGSDFGEDHEIYYATRYYEEITIPLSTGWNFISVPVNTFKNPVNEIFSELGYYHIYEYSNREYIVPEHIEPGKGYWILVLEDTTLTIEGIPASSKTIDLKEGWNMIGCIDPILDPSSLITEYYQTMVWSQGQYQLATSWDSCKAYWVFVLEETQIILP